MRIDETGPDEAAPEDPPLDPHRAWAERLHERTGEVELIISGALLFGLTQVPGQMDAWFDSLSLRLSGSYYEAVFVAWYYTKLIVFTLIGAFGLHIFARAYWVGLLGLDSVFPNGVRWQNIRYGRIAKDEYRRNFRSLPTLARRADDFASTIFSIAFWVVLLFLLSVIMSGVAGLLAVGLRRWLVPDAKVGTVWLAVMLAFAAVPLVSMSVDRFVGGRLKPGGVTERFIRWVVRAGYYAYGGPLLMPIQFTLFSNLRRGVMWGALGVFFVGLMTFFVVGENLRRGEWVVAGSEAFPVRPGAATADARHYEDAGADADVPTVQSDIVRGPYVRLRVPFVARRDADRLRERCPRLPALGRRGIVATDPRDAPPDPAEEAALLTCMGGLWRVSLDGEPVRPDWVFDATGQSGVRGLAAYFATAALSPGGHVLEIVEVPDAADGAPPDPDGEPRVRRWFVRFWI